MLKSKKIKKRKLVIYIIIMTVMFGSTGFFLYKNYELTSNKNLTEYNNLFTSDGFKDLDIEDNRESVIVIEEEKTIKILDTDIFNDPKFNALRDNTVKQSTNIDIGRENPFEPY